MTASPSTTTTVRAYNPSLKAVPPEKYGEIEAIVGRPCDSSNFRGLFWKCATRAAAEEIARKIRAIPSVKADVEVDNPFLVEASTNDGVDGPVRH